MIKIMSTWLLNDPQDWISKNLESRAVSEKFQILKSRFGIFHVFRRFTLDVLATIESFQMMYCIKFRLKGIRITTS